MNWWNKIWWRVTCITDYKNYATSDIIAELTFKQRFTGYKFSVNLTDNDYVEYVKTPNLSLNKHFKQ